MLLTGSGEMELLPPLMLPAELDEEEELLLLLLLAFLGAPGTCLAGEADTVRRRAGAGEAELRPRVEDTEEVRRYLRKLMFLLSCAITTVPTYR